MEARIKKKLRLIGLILLIIIIPAGYYLSISIAIDDVNRDMMNVTINFHNDSLKNRALKSTNRAIFLMPWNKAIRANRILLLFSLKKYHKALEAAKEDVKISGSGMCYEREGLAYEYLGEMDLAISCYHKAIIIYEEELKERPNDDFLISEIAILSMIVSDTNRAKEVIESRNKSNNETLNESIQQVHQAILNYKTGGMRFFIEGKLNNL